MSGIGPSCKRRLTGLQILIAEDSWHLAVALRQTLEAAGATVTGVAATVAQAEKLSRTASYDVAVMDLNLHDQMTTPLVLKLAEAGVKVVVLTGYDVGREMAGRVHACLAKPVSSAALIDAILNPGHPA